MSRNTTELDFLAARGTAEQVEIATLVYVDWFNHRRLYEECRDIPPAELETVYHRHHSDVAKVGLSTI